MLEDLWLSATGKNLIAISNISHGLYFFIKTGNRGIHQIDASQYVSYMVVFVSTSQLFTSISWFFSRYSLNWGSRIIWCKCKQGCNGSFYSILSFIAHTSMSLNCIPTLDAINFPSPFFHMLEIWLTTCSADMSKGVIQPLRILCTHQIMLPKWYHANEKNRYLKMSDGSELNSDLSNINFKQE